MASDYNVKQHDVREVEYNIYEDPIFGSTFTQLSVSDIKAGTGKIHTYDGEDAEFIYNILVGNFDAGKRISELNKVISDKNDTIKNLEFVIEELEKDVQLSRKKYADLERDYQYYVKDKTEIFNKREKYINELKDTIHKERKKYAEATKLNDDLHKDLAQWKQMYEELMRERDALKTNLATLSKVNRDLGIQRDKFKKELAEEKLVRTALEGNVHRNTETLREQEKKIEVLERQNEILSLNNTELLRDNEILKTGHNIDDIRTIDHLRYLNNKFESENKKLDEIVENQASTIRELEEKNNIQESTIHKLETVISKKSNEIQNREHRLEQERKTILEYCNRIDNLTEQNRELKNQNDELQKRNEGLCKRLDEEAGKTYCSEDIYDARIAYLESENEKLENEYVACMDTIKAQQRAVSDLNGELKIVRDANESLKSKKADLIKKIEELEMKLKNAQESNGKIWSMYAEQYAKNVERRVPDFGLKMENRRLTIEIESLNRAHRDIMDDVANSNRVIERLKKEIERLEKEPKYMQISGFRSGSMILKLMGENNKLKKERDNALEALSEKDCALAEALAELMKRRPCCGCPFKS